MLYLQPVSLTDGREFYDMLQQIGSNENGFINRVCGMDYEYFPLWLEKQVNIAQGVGLADWMVPSSSFWLMDGGVPVGKGNRSEEHTSELQSQR